MKRKDDELTIYEYEKKAIIWYNRYTKKPSDAGNTLGFDNQSERD